MRHIDPSQVAISGMKWAVAVAFMLLIIITLLVGNVWADGIKCTNTFDGKPCSDMYKTVKWQVSWESVSGYCIGSEPEINQYGVNSMTVYAICNWKTRTESHSRQFDIYEEAKAFYDGGKQYEITDAVILQTGLRNFKLYKIEEINP